MSQYFLGVDGGGSKTEYLVVDENNNVLYHSFSKGTSIPTFPFDESVETLKEKMREIPYPLSSIFMGIGDLSSEEDSNRLIQAIRKFDFIPKDCLINIKSDVYSALAGALDGEDGIIVISGTGSACFGRKGELSHRCGGYSYVENDFGSAYYLGIEALRYLAKVIDGREKETSFSLSLKEATGAKDYPSLTHYFNEKSRTEVASLAPIVTSSKDSNAKRIMRRSAKELYLMVKTVYETLGFDGHCLFSIIGSCGNKPSYFSTYFKELIRKNLPNIEIIEKRKEAVEGSLILAKKALIEAL